MEPLVQTMLDQFLLHLLRGHACDAAVGYVVSPERIDVSFLTPELAVILVVRMVRILGCDETQIMRQSWV